MKKKPQNKINLIVVTVCLKIVIEPCEFFTRTNVALGNQDGNGNNSSGF
jgi:hypothetical protein